MGRKSSAEFGSEVFGNIIVKAQTQESGHLAWFSMSSYNWKSNMSNQVGKAPVSATLKPQEPLADLMFVLLWTRLHNSGSKDIWNHHLD